MKTIILLALKIVQFLKPNNKRRGYSIENIIIREYNTKDIDQIIELNQRVFSKQEHFEIKRDRVWFEWKNLKNPFGESIIIVSENENKEIVGSRIFWAWKFKIRMNEFLAYQPIDTVVDPNYQGKGLFYKMTKKALDIALEKNSSFIFNFPNQNSLPGNLNLGWSYVSKLIWYVKIKNPGYVFNQNKQAESLSDLKNYKITEEKIKDIKFKDNFDGKVKATKSFSFIKWRYIDHPFFNYGIITYKKNKKEICGIFSINNIGNYREMFVVDIIGDYRLIEGLLKKVNEAAKEFNVSVVYILRNPYFNDLQMFKSGYIKLKNKNLVCLPLNLCLEGKLLKYNEWEMFGGLHDAL